MTRQLDLPDIQGGILREYGGDFPVGRYFFLHIGNAEQGRALMEIARRWITTAVRWHSKAEKYPGEIMAAKPPVTLNIGFSFRGLLALGLPTRTLRELPPEFIDGMAQRANVLGDVGRNDPKHWDPIWTRNNGKDVHVIVIMRAQVNEAGEPVAQMAEMTARIFEYCAKHDVEVLGGHRGSAGTYQDASILLATRDGKATRSGKEHFGFTDGISEVAFEEQGADARVAGGGKIGPDGQWLPHATGEFLLGHPDESQELPPAPYPSALTRNGTFLAYRKLHQNVRTFNAYIDKAAADYAAMSGTTADEARDFIKAKMIGRWPDGTPVEHAPTLAAKRQFDAQTEGILAGPEDAKSKEEKSWRRLVDFRYKDDPEGVRCPMGAHIRRVNTRDMLDPNHTSILNNRRRILRRGLPYGRVDPAAPDDGGEHGVIFLAYCASLFRQFEFIQQQWLQYGLDFNGGNDRCPILGNRVKDENHKFVIASDGADGSSPFICGDLPQFVETRGGEYFFMPSMTALRMMAMGTVDPT